MNLKKHFSAYINMIKKVKEDPLEKKKENAQMRRSVEVACARGRTMKKLLQYDVSSSSYLFDHEGMMTKPQKSEQVWGIEMKPTNDDERVLAEDSELQTACIADG
jgi:hypothetical protein